MVITHPQYPKGKGVTPRKTPLMMYQRTKDRKRSPLKTTKKQTDPGNDTDSHNLDEVELVNSDNGARGKTSENSAATPTPTPNRMRM